MKAKKYILLILIVSLLSSCSIFIKKPDKIKTNKDVKTEKDELTYTYAFFEGNKQKMLGNYDNAAAYFAKCLQLKKTSSAAMYELSKIYYLQKDFENALAFAKQAVKHNPNNFWYSSMLSTLYRQNKEIDKSIEILTSLKEKYPEKLELIFELASSNAMIGKTSEAIKLYNELEKKYGVTEEISLEKERIYLYKKDKEKARGELRKLIEAFPEEVKYRGLLAESLLSDMRNDEAFIVYQELNKIDSTNGLIHLSMSEYYRVTGNYLKAFDKTKLAFASSDVDGKIKAQILVPLISKSKFDTIARNQAQELIDISLNNDSNDTYIRILYSDYLIQKKEFKEARNQLQKVIVTKKDNEWVWEQLLYLESEVKDYNAMAKESAEAMELYPNKPNFYLLNGIANFLLKKNKKAIDALETGLGYVVDNNAQKIQFLLYLGDASYRIKDYVNSDKYFDNLLDIDKSNSYVLNNYSYYLSIRGEKLDRAEKMSRMCIELNPKNGTYLDTYAWVLYKRKKYELAKTNIEDAIKFGGGRSAVIVEHYADILYKLNKKEEALEKWKEAKEIGKGSKFLEEKINTGKLVE